MTSSCCLFLRYLSAVRADAELVAEIRRGLAAHKRGKSKLYTLDELLDGPAIGKSLREELAGRYEESRLDYGSGLQYFGNTNAGITWEALCGSRARDK